MPLVDPVAQANVGMHVVHLVEPTARAFAFALAQRWQVAGLAALLLALAFGLGAVRLGQSRERSAGVQVAVVRAGPPTRAAGRTCPLR